MTVERSALAVGILVTRIEQPAITTSKRTPAATTKRRKARKALGDDEVAERAYLIHQSEGGEAVENRVEVD